MRLLAEVPQGLVITALAAEGGLQRTLSAGPEKVSRAMLAGEHAMQGMVRSGPVSLRLGFAFTDQGQAIDLSLPMPSRW